MRLPQRLLTVVSFAVVSMLALVLSGMLDWITSVLFLGLEFLAESLRPLLSPKQKKGQARTGTRSRGPSLCVSPARDRHRRVLPRRSRYRHLRNDLLDDEPVLSPPVATSPKARVLVPLSGDRPGLIAFALRECRERQAEMILLFVRPIAYMPMGPNSWPNLTEDGRAKALFDRVALEAQEAGVPLRVRYEASRDMPGTILDVAQTLEADVLLMEASRRRLMTRALLGDQIQSVLMHLPNRVSLLLHTP